MDIGAFEWAQGVLRGLLIALHGRLPLQSVDQLSELVDAAELPMALDVLLQALEHHSVVPTTDEREQLLALAKRLVVSTRYLDSLS